MKAATEVDAGASSRKTDGARRSGILPTGSLAEVGWRGGLVLEVIAILLFWEIAVGTFELVRPAFLPPPSAIWASLMELASSAGFWSELRFSVSNLVVGFLLSAVLGILVGFAVGWFRLLRFTVAPFLWLLYSTPKVALAPLLILGLGLGSASKIALVFLLSFFPIALNTMDGVETVSESLVRAGRVYGCRGTALARKVIIPATFPFLLVGLQRGIALGFIGEVLGEFLGGSGGIGHALERYVLDFRMDDALAVVLIMVVVANSGLVILTLLRKRYAPWHESDVAQL